MNSGETLKNYGFNTAEARTLSLIPAEKRKKVLENNILFYADEVLENLAVSLPYQYYFNADGEIFTDSSLEEVFNLKLQIDDQERNGWTHKGIYRALNLARENPFELTAFYSPAGPGELYGNGENDFSKIEYDYGQLYFLFYDYEKINEVALTVSGEGEKFIEELFEVNNSEWLTQTDKIILYLDNPRTLGDYRGFFQRPWRENYLIHKNKDGNYYLYDVLKSAEEGLMGKKRESRNLVIDDIVERTLNREITAESIFRAYMSVIHRFMQENDLSKTSLAGSCGGSLINISQVELILGFSAGLGDKPISSMVSGFSSVLRSFYQTDNEWRQGICVLCGNFRMVGGCGFCKTCEKNPEEKRIKKYNQYEGRRGILFREPEIAFSWFKNGDNKGAK